MHPHKKNKNITRKIFHNIRLFFNKPTAKNNKEKISIISSKLKLLLPSNTITSQTQIKTNNNKFRILISNMFGNVFLKDLVIIKSLINRRH